MPSEAPIAVVRAGRAALGDALRAWLMGALRHARGSVVGLAVGESTLPLYGALPTGDPAWEARRILPVDELIPGPARPERAFAARLRAALPPGLAARVGDLPEPDELEAMIARDGLAAIVLGLGPDGHVAFNQSGSAGDSRARVVDLSPANLARLGDVAPAARALTMGIGTLLSAEAIALVVSGPGKDSALARVLEGPTDHDVPATFLRAHPSLAVFTCD